MPKATLAFDLPEEREEYELAVNAGKLHTVLCELHLWLRNKDKYEDDESAGEVRAKLFEIMNEVGVEL